jgi:hypothetical protein
MKLENQNRKNRIITLKVDFYYIIDCQVYYPYLSIMVPNHLQMVRNIQSNNYVYCIIMLVKMMYIIFALIMFLPNIKLIWYFVQLYLKHFHYIMRFITTFIDFYLHKLNLYAVIKFEYQTLLERKLNLL